MRKPDFEEQANCWGKDPKLFFSHKYHDQQRAKKICAACPIELECLDWALEQNEPEGIWGGVTATARMELRRARSTA